MCAISEMADIRNPPTDRKRTHFGPTAPGGRRGRDNIRLPGKYTQRLYFDETMPLR